MIEATAQVKIHQVDGYVWCDAHEGIHVREQGIFHRGTDLGEPDLRCNAESWRPVFTTDSKLGVL